MLSVGRDNHLNLIRALAAVGVLVSHAYPLVLGEGSVAPLKALFDENLGSICVVIFFAISGFLVVKSAERKNDPLLWAYARAARIMPGLIVALIVIVTVLGPAVTSVSVLDYVMDPHVYFYVLRNASLVHQQTNLPGVFENAPLWPTVNGSLWTLHAEALCYLAVFSCILIARGKLRAILIIAVGIFLFVYALSTVTGEKYTWSYFNSGALKYGLPFSIGVLCALHQGRIPLTLPIFAGLAVLWFAFRDTALAYEVLALAISYGTFWAAFRFKGRLLIYNRVGDFSYGLYIYAWPIQQLGIEWQITHTPLQNILWSFPITLALAVASWHFVERPSISGFRSYSISIEKNEARI